MADATVTRKLGEYDMSLFLATWTLTTADPTGTAVEIPEWADRTWQVGTGAESFGGGTVAIEGCHSNVDGDFKTLSNAAGATPTTFTAVGVKTVIELTRYMRPKITGSAGASVTVTLMARRANPMRT